MLKSCDFRVALPKLLPLAGETLINAWQNQTNPTQALVYTAASIFNPNFVTNAQIAFGAAFDPTFRTSISSMDKLHKQKMR
ncbi:MAG: hypothetical protein V7K67_20305 [Nostoc sp.]|uniref:hypothetical protein n=1 Tax=Nostoc sp. TaxID=1180 RepID=UPI002FF68AFC